VIANAVAVVYSAKTLFMLISKRVRGIGRGVVGRQN
jgi:hypothetical protein